MEDRFRGLKIGLYGFAVALVGVLFGFAGFHFDVRSLALLGFGLSVIGVLTGFVGIVHGWATQGKRVIRESVEVLGKARDRRE